jgi:SagB-type dehydrogenase family enzyme
MPLAEAIVRRRSIRSFTAQPVSQSQLSQLLLLTQGITDASWGLRAVPSAGATYPLELFIVCGDSTIIGLAGGVYRYRPDNRSLVRHHEGDIRAELARAALDQDFIRRAPLVIIICAIYERTTRRYGKRGERYVHMEVGHAGQNIYLQATALGLGTAAVGAFDDEQVRQVLRLEKQYQPLYIMPVGWPA